MQTITHNLISQFTDRQLNITSKEKGKAAEKLASGYKINRSADDAAGLSISEKMRWQIRGLNKASNNVEDGISLLQVADGALNEVHDMLQRMKELSVQAANDTNTRLDRDAIQKELDRLCVEIDRIGDTTEFNTLKIFKGGYTQMTDPNGNPISSSQIPISDLRLSSGLDNFPFNATSNSQTLNLSVSTIEGYNPPSQWNLIFSSGSTSHSAIRVTYLDDNGNTATQSCFVEDMSVSDPVIAPDGSVCERKLSYDFGDNVRIEMTQEIVVGANNGTGQDYQFSYKIKNTGARQARYEFMFNADTAYNNIDRCEEYYIGGAKVDNFCMYTDNDYYKNQNPQYVQDISQIAGGFSIFDADSDGEDAPPFSEKITWTNQPNTVLIRPYSSSEDEYGWGYYDRLNNKLGGNTEDRDLVFSMIWDSGTMQASGDQWGPILFNYGIIKTDSDNNLTGVPISRYPGRGTHTNQLDLWIQSGAKNKNGHFITINEMNCTELGINSLNVSSFQNAGRAISAVDAAIDKLSEQRSSIGAQQNRLEYTKSVDDNTAENTQASESRLRDTDMAEEMVGYTKHSILEQAGQAMLAQANQTPQGVLTLFS